MIAAGKYRQASQQYAADVLSGRRLSCKKVRQACQRYRDDLEKAESDPDYPYRMAWDIAEDSCRFFELLQHSTGEYDGQPFSLYPFQAFIVSNIFGWRRKVDGLRRFQTVFYSVGRGNGKSPLAAGLTLQTVFCDEPIEARAEGYCVATKSDQARIVFDEVKRFVERCPALKKALDVYQHKIEKRSNGSVLRPMASEGKTADGQVPHVVALDEVHAMTHCHRDLLERVETGFIKRTQPLLLITTTAGDENSEIWQEYYNLCDNILDPESSITGENLFAFIAEIDEEDDELDELMWQKSNPLLEFGVVKIDSLRSHADLARTNPGKRAQFRRFYGNRLTVSTVKSITPEMWDGCNKLIPDISSLDTYLGVDLGWKNDLASVGYVTPLDEFIGGKRCYAVAADVWIPAHSKFRDLAKSPWAGWIADGWLRTTDTLTTDPEAIYQRLEERSLQRQIRSLAFDVNNAQEFSVHVVNRVGIPRTYAFAQKPTKYNEPFREFLDALENGRIYHGGNPLLRWCAMNVVERTDQNGNRMPDKSRSREKIDPIIAIIMALSEAMFDAAPSGSIYETRGPLFV